MEDLSVSIKQMEHAAKNAKKFKAEVNNLTLRLNWRLSIRDSDKASIQCIESSQWRIDEILDRLVVLGEEEWVCG